MNNNFVEIVRKTAGISEEALHEAELIGDESSIRLDEILIRNKLINESQLLEVYSIQYNIPFWPDLPIGQLGNSR